MEATPVPDTPAPTAKPLRVVCPAAGVDGAQVRDSTVEVMIDSAAEVSLTLTSNVTKQGSVVWASKQPGFVKYIKRDVTAGNTVFLLGHSRYVGKEREDVTVTVNEAHTGLEGQCSFYVKASDGPESRKAPAIGDVGTVLVMASWGSAAAATTLSLVSTPLCGERGKLPLTLHPTGITIDDSEYLGVIVGNVSIAVGVTLLSYIVVYAVLACLPSMLPVAQILSAKGLTRFPSVALFFFLFLFQGTSFASLHLIAYPQKGTHFICGLACTLFCVVIPIWTAWRIRRDVPTKGLYKYDTVYSSKTARFLIGPGEWVAVSAFDLWHQRFFSMIKPYHERTSWFAVFSFLLSLAVAGLSVPKTSTMPDCGNIKLGIGVLFLVMTMFVFVMRPYARGRDNILLSVLHALTATAVLLQAAGFYSENNDDSRFSAANAIFGVCFIIVLVKMVVDLLCDLFVLVKGRRGRLLAEQLALREKEKDIDLATEEMLPVSDPARSRSDSSVEDALLESSMNPANISFVSSRSPRAAKNASYRSPFGSPTRMLSSSYPSSKSMLRVVPITPPTSNELRMALSSSEITRAEVGARRPSRGYL